MFARKKYWRSWIPQLWKILLLVTCFSVDENGWIFYQRKQSSSRNPIVLSKNFFFFPCSFFCTWNKEEIVISFLLFFACRDDNISFYWSNFRAFFSSDLEQLVISLCVLFVFKPPLCKKSSSYFSVLSHCLSLSNSSSSRTKEPWTIKHYYCAIIENHLLIYFFSPPVLSPVLL